MHMEWIFVRPYTALVAVESQAGGSKEGDKDQCSEHGKGEELFAAKYPTRKKDNQQVIEYKIYQQPNAFSIQGIDNLDYMHKY